MALRARAIESQQHASGVFAMGAFKSRNGLGYLCAWGKWLHLRSAFWAGTCPSNADADAESTGGTAEAECHIRHFRPPLVDAESLVPSLLWLALRQPRCASHV